MLREEKRREKRQEEQRRHLVLKHNALQLREEVDERMRNSSVFSSGRETKVPRTAQGSHRNTASKNMAAYRSRSKDATRFRPHINDTETTDKTEQLNDQSFSQAYLNTLISSSQQIKVG